MSIDHPESFANNWDYLKTELRWLDQVLMMAVTRQRKEAHEVDRLSQSRADRVTSHWWKGLVSLEGEAAYDEHRQPSSKAKVSYQQQLETRIQSSQRRGVPLALPHLRDRLGLTLFEKNVVLMSLAPEMNRRYARLYRYLQGEDAARNDLPTVDLVLRLLCRNDSEWRSARMRLTASPLVRHHLLQVSGSIDTFLNRPLQLTESLIHYLLAEQPTEQALEILLRQPDTRPPLLDQSVESVDWSKLVLPQPLLTSLQYLVQRVEGYAQAEETWGFDGSDALKYHPGAIALLVGNPGTGKSFAANAIAHALDTPLYVIDLDQIEPADYLHLLEEIQTQDPTVLLVKSARHWLGRPSRYLQSSATPLSSAAIHQFLTQRRSLPGVTLFSEHRAASLQLSWQKQMDQVLTLPMPGLDDRRQLWKQAFCLSVPRMELDWDNLATLKLSGGEIAAIAHESILYAAAVHAPKLTLAHILQVLNQRGKVLKISQPIHKKRKVQKTEIQIDRSKLNLVESDPIQLNPTKPTKTKIKREKTSQSEVTPVTKKVKSSSSSTDKSSG
jgi:ABC-type dipeptide/oligopeptide/nickel transport system ATPase component